jgi:hypothetical protein
MLDLCPVAVTTERAREAGGGEDATDARLATGYLGGGGGFGRGGSGGFVRGGGGELRLSVPGGIRGGSGGRCWVIELLGAAPSPPV